MNIGDQYKYVFEWVDGVFPRKNKKRNSGGRNLDNLLITSFIFKGLDLCAAVKKAESTFNY